VARGGVTGILLVGGASRRFGSPKALARIGDETLAERTWRTLGDACEERLAVGKLADRLALPFPLVDDGTEVRASLAGVVAGLRASRTDVAVVLPVDVPLIGAESLRALAGACADAAVTQTGPLPAAFHKRTLPVLERLFREAAYELRAALDELETATVHVDPAELVNVNEPADLRALAG
jgi:molybdopterin-guanine dinucleotide biosynthesis protein A